MNAGHVAAFADVGRQLVELTQKREVSLSCRNQRQSVRARNARRLKRRRSRRRPGPQIARLAPVEKRLEHSYASACCERLACRRGRMRGCPSVQFLWTEMAARWRRHASLHVQLPI